MGRLRRKFWLLLGCGIAVVLIVMLLREREPRYEGHSLDEWDRMLESDDNPSVTNAERAVQHIGANALPFLIKWIQYEEKPWRRHLETLCDKLPDQFARPLNKLMADHGFDRQQGAFSALYILGPKARPAMPTLVHLIQTDPLNIQQSMTVLAGIGGDAFTPVLDVITNRVSPHRLVAINALFELDRRRPLDQIVVSTLTNCLAEPDPELTFRAAQILCYHNLEKELAMKTLVDGLESGNARIRRQAISSLRFSLQLGYSISAPLEFVQDTNSPLSPYAAGALGELADRAKMPETVLPALTNALHDPRPLVRSYAASAVGHFREAAEPAAPTLLELWNDPNSSVRQAATNALFELPTYAVLRTVAQWPMGMSDEQMLMYEQSYGLPLHTVEVTNLLNHPDARVRQIATTAFRMLVDRTMTNANHQP